MAATEIVTNRNAAGGPSPRLGRLTQKRREVMEVERHHDSLFFSTRGEHLGIVASLRIAALVKREHIVTQFPRLVGNHPARAVHGRWLLR